MLLASSWNARAVCSTTTHAITAAKGFMNCFKSPSESRVFKQVEVLGVQASRGFGCCDDKQERDKGDYVHGSLV